MTNIRHFSLYKIFFSLKKKDRKDTTKERERKHEKKYELFKSYCLSEYELRVIDEPDTCGLIERRGTSC